MPIPKVYAKAGINALANYSYTDIAEGTGIVNFQGFKHNEAGVGTHSLTTENIYSNGVYTLGTSSGASFYQTTDLNFDIVFNKPQRIKGKARASYSIGSGSASPSCPVVSYVVISLNKVSGTETNIVTVSGAITASPGDSEILYETQNVEANISNMVHFKKGDTLRVGIEVWAKKVGTSNGQTYFLHDPKNRVDTVSVVVAGNAPLTSQFIVSVPFVIDL